MARFAFRKSTLVARKKTLCACVHVCMCTCMCELGLAAERAGREATLNAGRPVGGCYYSRGSMMKYIFILQSNYICSVPTLCEDFHVFFLNLKILFISQVYKIRTLPIFPFLFLSFPSSLPSFFPFFKTQGNCRSGYLSSFLK